MTDSTRTPRARPRSASSPRRTCCAGRWAWSSVPRRRPAARPRRAAARRLAPGPVGRRPRRRAGPAGEPRPDRGGAPHAGRRHRRQRRHLQRRQRGAAAPAAVRGSRSPGRLLGLGAQEGAAGRGLGGRVLRALPHPRPRAAAGRRLRRIPVHDHERHRRGRAHPRRRRHRRLLRDARARSPIRGRAFTSAEERPAHASTSRSSATACGSAATAAIRRSSARPSRPRKARRRSSA